MIPEHYWTVLRSWAWLIALLGVLGGLFGLYVIPVALGGSSDSYSSSVTLGVGRFLSFNGTVTGASDGTALGDYTKSIASLGETAQFRARLHDAIKDRGLSIPETALARKVSVDADSGLYRITIETTGASEHETEILADEASKVIIDQITSEESRVRESLSANSQDKQKELLARLSDLYLEREQKIEELDAPALEDALRELGAASAVGDEDLSEEFRKLLLDIGRVTGDSDLALLNSRVEALEAELADTAQAQQSYSIDLLSWGAPVFVLNPVDTVAIESDEPLRKRDMMVLGGGAGLVVGWLSANMAQQMRNGGRSGRREDEDDSDGFSADIH